MCFAACISRQVCKGRPGTDFVWLRGVAGPDQVRTWIIAGPGRWHEGAVWPMMALSGQHSAPEYPPQDVTPGGEISGCRSGRDGVTITVPADNQPGVALIAAGPRSRPKATPTISGDGEVGIGDRERFCPAFPAVQAASEGRQPASRPSLAVVAGGPGRSSPHAVA